MEEEIIPIKISELRKDDSFLVHDCPFIVIEKYNQTKGCLYAVDAVEKVVKFKDPEQIVEKF